MFVLFWTVFIIARLCLYFKSFRSKNVVFITTKPIFHLFSFHFLMLLFQQQVVYFLCLSVVKLTTTTTILMHFRCKTHNIITSSPLAQHFTDNLAINILTIFAHYYIFHILHQLAPIHTNKQQSALVVSLQHNPYTYFLQHQPTTRTLSHQNPKSAKKTPFGSNSSLPSEPKYQT